MLTRAIVCTYILISVLRSLAKVISLAVGLLLDQGIHSNKYIECSVVCICNFYDIYYGILYTRWLAVYCTVQLGYEG